MSEKNSLHFGRCKLSFLGPRPLFASPTFENNNLIKMEEKRCNNFDTIN